MKKIIITLIVGIFIVVNLVACKENSLESEENTLESYYKNTEVLQILDDKIEQQLKDPTGLYSDITYSIEGNTFYYHFYLKKETKVEGDLKKLREEYFISMLEMQVPEIKAESNVKDTITVGYIIYNPGGKEYINVSLDY
ncbi:MAG: hypothetical protein ACI4F4_08115 [Lachnospiraceae bacterium]